jgi:hypothetical protein
MDQKLYLNKNQSYLYLIPRVLLFNYISIQIIIQILIKNEPRKNKI